MSTELVHVRTVYGETLHVARKDWEGDRFRLPIRCPNGSRLDDLTIGHRPALPNCYIHRENIARVV